MGAQQWFGMIRVQGWPTMQACSGITWVPQWPIDDIAGPMVTMVGDVTMETKTCCLL
jgi:hypothetical protein